MVLEYFYTFTLPLFDNSEPNLLWQCLRRDAPNDQTLCYIAAALGHEHMHKAQEHLLAYREKSCRFNGRALRSMQKCLSMRSSTRIVTAAFLSLIMAILQGLRGQHADMLVHLRCGFTIAQQGIKEYGRSHPQLNEALRLLRRYCVSSILFDSIGMEADKTAAVMTNEAGSVKDLPSNWGQNVYGLLTELDIFIEELLQFMRGFRAAHHDASGNVVAVHTLARAHPYHNASLGLTLSKLAAKQTIIELALEERLSAKQEAEKSAVLLEFALLQCLLAKIYLRCCCNKESFFEDELPTFQRILDLERASLTVLRLTKQPLCAMPFSLGLGAIGCLVSVVRLCPSTQIRQAAIQMLDLCPPTEGFWSVELARRLCITTTKFEEQLTVAETGICLAPARMLPRHCRIYYHSFVAASEQSVPKVRFFRSVGSTEILTCENVILSDRSKMNNALTSVSWR